MGAGRITTKTTTASRGERRVLKSATVRIELPEGEPIEPCVERVVCKLGSLFDLNGARNEHIAKVLENGGEFTLMDKGGVKVHLTLPASSTLEIVALPSEGIRPHRMPKWPAATQREAEALSERVRKLLTA